MLTELGKRIDLNTEHFNEELENIEKGQWEMTITTAEIKTHYKEMNH